MQALEQRVGSSVASQPMAKHRMVPLAVFNAGRVAALVADVAPDGFPRVPWDLSFRVYALPRRTTTFAIYVLASQVENVIGCLRVEMNRDRCRSVS